MQVIAIALSTLIQQQGIKSNQRNIFWQSRKQHMTNHICLHHSWESICQRRALSSTSIIY